MGSRNFTYGYVRVSTADQNTARQYEALGECDRIYEDRLSGKDKNRPQLVALLADPGPLREGDTLKVASMDRLARSLPDLLSIVRDLTERGIEVRFVKEALTFKPGASDPYANFQMHVLGAVAELERNLIAERRAEGIAVAKKAGKYRGRKPALTKAQIEQARERIAAGEHVAAIARDFKVGRSSLYRALNGEGTYAAAA